MLSLLLVGAAPSVGWLLAAPAVHRHARAPPARASLVSELPAQSLASSSPAVTIGPVEATLELLEWPRLSAQVASFASTTCGRETILSEGLQLPTVRAESEALLVETAEAHTLEQVLATPIELRGFRELEPLVSRASKGGVLTGEQLVEVASSLVVAQALVKRLRSVQVEVAEESDRVVQALPALFEGIPVQAELRRAIGDAVDDSGSVRDSAQTSLGDVRFAMRELASAARRLASTARFQLSRGERCACTRQAKRSGCADLRRRRACPTVDRRIPKPTRRSELNRMIQLKAEALATRTITLRDDRYVLQVAVTPVTLRPSLAAGGTRWPRAACGHASSLVHRCGSTLYWMID